MPFHRQIVLYAFVREVREKCASYTERRCHAEHCLILCLITLRVARRTSHTSLPANSRACNRFTPKTLIIIARNVQIAKYRADVRGWYRRWQAGRSLSADTPAPPRKTGEIARAAERLYRNRYTNNSDTDSMLITNQSQLEMGYRSSETAIKLRPLTLWV